MPLTAGCRARTNANTAVVASSKKVDIKKQGLASVKDKIVQANLMGVSEKMNKKGWTDSQGRKGKVSHCYCRSPVFNEQEGCPCLDNNMELRERRAWAAALLQVVLRICGLLAKQWQGVLQVVVLSGASMPVDIPAETLRGSSKHVVDGCMTPLGDAKGVWPLSYNPDWLCCRASACTGLQRSMEPTWMATAPSTPPTAGPSPATSTPLAQRVSLHGKRPSARGLSCGCGSPFWQHPCKTGPPGSLAATRLHTRQIPWRGPKPVACGSDC